jgi:CIC family chloride channel protein
MAQLMTRLGLRDHYVLLPMAVIVGVVTAAAAVAFHRFINFIRDSLYASRYMDFLYGHGICMLILLPALGGLAVGLFTVYVVRSREGHGIVDVMESVIRNRGVIKPLSAVEKIITSAITIGTGGSAGAEGPIVQIGAAIASGVGMLFGVARAQMPVLVACGSAAGISAIFDSPIGGVLFTLEVILLDFSIRAFAPVVLCSVIANVTMHGIFSNVLHDPAHAIFVLPENVSHTLEQIGWGSVPGLLLLGVVCGVAGVSMTRLMYWMDEAFHRLPIRREWSPALGGALLGVLGVVYVMGFGWLMLGQLKPVNIANYPMPAFFGDGYGAIKPLLSGEFYNPFAGHFVQLFLLLLFLCVAKIVGTCLSLSSGGSGGIIAPSLFLGATAGGLFGLVAKALHFNHHNPPMFYAIIGMGAVLAAVVHAPLSSILILFEVTGQRNIILPAMLACVVATGMARMIFPDSIYTLTLRRRGVRLGTGADLTILRRQNIEQVKLEPVSTILASTPLEKVLELTITTGAGDFAVTELDGSYVGMVVSDDVKAVLIDREAAPLLLAGDLVRYDLPCVKNTDDLAHVLEIFSRYEVARLPVCLASNTSRVIGLVSRRALMDHYHNALQR